MIAKTFRSSTNLTSTLFTLMLACISLSACGSDSSPQSLKDIQFDVGALSPAFSPEQTMYTLTVPMWAADVRVLALADETDTTVSVNGKATNANQPSEAIAIASNAMTELAITIGSGKHAKTYTVVATRGDATKINYYKAHDTASGSDFGLSVDIDGDVLVASAPYRDGPALEGAPNGYPDYGAIYVFERSGAEWKYRQKIVPSGVRNSDVFGYSVAISGDTIAASAPNGDIGRDGPEPNPQDLDNSDQGEVYVFVKDGDQWKQQAYIAAPNPDLYDNFGTSIDLDGDTLVVGSPHEDTDPKTLTGGAIFNEDAAQSGAVYVFKRSGSTWTQEAFLKASNAHAQSRFGWSVAIDDDTVVVGALEEDSTAVGVKTTGSEVFDASESYNAGAAYVFARQGVTWTEQAYLKPNTAQRGGDNFGQSVAISGDTVAVGAHGEDSLAVGVNPDPALSLSQAIDTNAGAVYVFTRSGVTWVQQAYLKASNPGARDNFGYSVALDRNTLVVGAPYEDSNARGVNGSQESNDAVDSGAAYVFTRLNGAWTQKSYLKASNTRTGDMSVAAFWFGHSVTVQQNNIVVGSRYETSSGVDVNGKTDDYTVMWAGAAYLY